MAEAEHPPLPPLTEDEQQRHADMTHASSSSFPHSHSLARYLQEQSKKQQSAEQEDSNMYRFHQGKSDYLYGEDVDIAAVVSSSSSFAVEPEEEDEQGKGNDEKEEEVEEEEEEEEEEYHVEEDAIANTSGEAKNVEEEIHTDEEMENGKEEGGESFLAIRQTPSTPPNILARSFASPLPLPRSLGLSPRTSFPAPAFHYANSLASSPSPSRVHVLLSRRDAAAKKLQEAEKEFELEFGLAQDLNDENEGQI